VIGQALAGTAGFTFPVVIFGNAVGDHLMGLPALRALAALFPGRLSLICVPGARRDLFADVPLRSVCEVEMRHRGRGRVFDSRHAAETIGQCDLLVSLNPWHSPSVDRLLRLLSPARSVGFSPAFDVVLPKDSKRHVADQVFALATHFDSSLRIEDFAFPPRLPRRCDPRIREFLESVAPGKRVLAVHNETKPEKVWPRERLMRLIDAFLDRHPDFVAFVLDFYPWKGRKPHRRVIHSPGLPLHYAFSVLSASDVFLGVDSCMLHAADLYRLPGVGLFGRANIGFASKTYNYRQWGFRFSRRRQISDARGMNYIREPRVLAALEGLLT
jgi:ADP-heptose:LPS heptosyltransferase